MVDDDDGGGGSRAAVAAAVVVGGGVDGGFVTFMRKARNVVVRCAKILPATRGRKETSSVFDQ